MKKNRIIQVLKCLVIAIIIYLVLVIVTSSNSFKNKTLNSNTNSMFTITDLTINNSKYKDILNSVITEFGLPLKIEEFNDNDVKYKAYTYDGLELTFKEENSQYILMKAKVSSDKYHISKGE